MVRKLLLVVVLVLLVGATVPTYAIIGGNLNSVQFFCDRLVANYNAFTFDRDNTGFGYEGYHVAISDGDGTILESGLAYNVVGYVLPANPNDTFYYTSAVADFNPIRIELIGVAGNGLSEQRIWDASGDCPGLPTYTPPPGVTVAGPGSRVPSNFVHRQIVCDVPIYNVPGGLPINDNRILNGQTWFVNPTPVEALNGESWTEIFVSGLQNPYIPTSCVNPDAAAVKIG